MALHVTVSVNGAPTELAEGSTVADLLALLGLGSGWVVVECNREVVPRAEHATVVLTDGDQLEVVRAVAGG